MNYIYDLLLNFNEYLYDFFEWNSTDKVIHVKKIPYFKISSKQFKDLKFGKVIMDDYFLKKISNKAESFNKSDNKNLKNAAIFSDGNDIIAIKFNKNGNNTFKSVLQIDEQDDILEIINMKKEKVLKYTFIKYDKINYFKTRFEIENIKFIKNELSKIYNAHDYKKLNYICVECLGKTEKSINKAIKLIKKEIIKENDNFYKIFDTLKMINQR